MKPPPLTTGYVDRLLARADGALATIWITGIFVTRDAVDREALRRGLELLIAEEPRLRMRFDERRKSWLPRETTEPARIVDAGRASLDEHAAALLLASIDLARDVPFRISVGELEDGRNVVGVQLHHSVGDGRASLALTNRFFSLSGGGKGRAPLRAPGMTDARALLTALRYPRAIAALRKPKHRVLAHRGRALSKVERPHVGAPTLDSLRARLPATFDSRAASGAFFGALLALCTALGAPEHNGPIRFRVPIDLRPRLGIGDSLENACSALSVELDASRVATLVAKGKSGADELSGLVPSALADLRARHLEWATLLECMTVSRLATRAMLREHLRPDLLADLRANTLVTTYLGNIAPYVQNAPFSIDSVQSHTPTWGATGFRVGNDLTLNLACFEGLWDRALREKASEAVQRWLADAYGIATERVA